MPVIASGCFTILKYVKNIGGAELERAIGFGSGRLKAGWTIVVLAESESLSADDFELAASTRWSGGLIPKKGGGTTSIEALLAARGEDPQALKRKVSAYFARGGDYRPAKVLPSLRHTSDMTYPDAEALGPGIRSGVMQFMLKSAKNFDIYKVHA